MIEERDPDDIQQAATRILSDERSLLDFEDDIYTVARAYLALAERDRLLVEALTRIAENCELWSRPGMAELSERVIHEAHAMMARDALAAPRATPEDARPAE